jgi:hypothetical protein
MVATRRGITMGTNDKEIKGIIKVLETEVFYEKFPLELRRYLLGIYAEEPWPYGYKQGELFYYIQQDAHAYFKGTLDTILPDPLEKSKEEIDYLRELYVDAMKEIVDLNNYIDEELHELLWSQGIVSSRMLPNSSGIFEGTYKEYNSF